MKFFQIALGASIAFAPLAARAQENHTWYYLNEVTATCDLMPLSNGITDPEAYMEQLRGEGIKPAIKTFSKPDGTLGAVIVRYNDAGGNDLQAGFFTDLGICQRLLASEEAQGNIVDPNANQKHGRQP